MPRYRSQNESAGFLTRWRGILARDRSEPDVSQEKGRWPFRQRVDSLRPGPPETPKPIDLTVEVEDAGGRTARLALGRFRLLQPQVEAHVAKAAWLSTKKASELVFDTFEVPLAAFREGTPGLDPSRLRAVRLLFDRTAEAVIVLDDLAIR